MDARPLQPIFVTTIEPEPNHLLGAHLLRLSLRRYPTPWQFRTCIARRDPAVTDRALKRAQALGLRAASCPPRSTNPFLNNWLNFDLFPELNAAPCVILLDYDFLYLGPESVPLPKDNAIGAGRNPTDMYRYVFARADRPLSHPALTPGGILSSSVNGGILVGSGRRLAECGKLTVHWERRVQDAIPESLIWQRQQIALSLAVGELGLDPLPDPWNATPLSPVADQDIRLWHYNASHDLTAQLKRVLHQPSAAMPILNRLASRWPRTLAVFTDLYRQKRSASSPGAGRTRSRPRGGVR